MLLNLEYLQKVNLYLLMSFYLHFEKETKLLKGVSSDLLYIFSKTQF